MILVSVRGQGSVERWAQDMQRARSGITLTIASGDAKRLRFVTGESIAVIGATVKCGRVLDRLVRNVTRHVLQESCGIATSGQLRSSSAFSMLMNWSCVIRMAVAYTGICVILCIPSVSGTQWSHLSG